MTIKFLRNLFSTGNNTIIDSNMMIRTGFLLSEEGNSTLQNIYFWGDGILGSLLSIIGLVMNFLAIYILMTREELKHMTTDLLCYLLWIENVFLFTRLINLCYFDFGFQTERPASTTHRSPTRPPMEEMGAGSQRLWKRWRRV